VRRLSLILALCVFWVLLSGQFSVFHLLAGLGSTIAVVWYTERRLRALDHEGHPFHLTVRAMTYWPWLAWEIAKAAWDVSKIILTPAPPISPVLQRVPVSQAGDIGKVIYANSITLTPGTISVELDEDGILVHALTTAGMEGVLSGDMDRRCAALEGRA
jgi:multicomponent Na+:H+ antiporter subunit E